MYIIGSHSDLFLKTCRSQTNKTDAFAASVVLPNSSFRLLPRDRESVSIPRRNRTGRSDASDRSNLKSESGAREKKNGSQKGCRGDRAYIIVVTTRRAQVDDESTARLPRRGA